MLKRTWIAAALLVVLALLVVALVPQQQPQQVSAQGSNGAQEKWCSGVKITSSPVARRAAPLQ